MRRVVLAGAREVSFRGWGFYISSVTAALGPGVNPPYLILLLFFFCFNNIFYFSVIVSIQHHNDFRCTT